MFPLFVNHPSAALVLAGTYLTWIVPESILTRSRRPRAGAQAHDRASRFVLMLCIFTGIFLGGAAAFVERQFAVPWERTALFGAGIVLMLGGEAFRLSAIRVLGKFFTVVVAIQPGQTVVEKGPYRWIRHPSYSGAILTFLGLGLVFGNWLSLLLIATFTAIGYGYRIRVEENALMEALGESYREYMKRTKRIIPFVI